MPCCVAEGQTRLFDVIRSAAEAREADRAGVWASFGQPYACLGEPKQVRLCRVLMLMQLVSLTVLLFLCTEGGRAGTAGRCWYR